ncbi:MAG: hypothetical protein LJE67_16100 [Salaquimonas sp.]|jgi:hypothetical protein|nr:hypothetical protein [Salaquimonas sp.]
MGNRFVAWGPTRKWPLLMLALALAACNSTGGNSVENTLDPLQVAGDKPKVDEVDDIRGYCPKIVMRAGTQTHDVYPAKMKKDDPQKEKKLRFRATITDVVRECNYEGDTLNIRVGVAGRLISGPTGETGDFTMPIRVAVTQGDSVLYSKLQDFAAQIPAGQANATFSYIDNDISIPRPQHQNIIIYAGFDELRVDLPNAVPAKDSLSRVN